MSSSISFYMYFTQVLCFPFPFLAIPWCPLFPLLGHTHTDCKPAVLEFQPCQSCHSPTWQSWAPLPQARYCTASCGCTGIFAKSNLNDDYWWDFLSDLWSCACREKETIPNTAVAQEADAAMRGYSLCNWKLCTSMGGVKKKKAKKPTKIIFFMTVQYSRQFYKLPRILLPGITKHCGIHLRFAVLGITYTVHENTHFSPKNKWESAYK